METSGKSIHVSKKDGSLQLIENQSKNDLLKESSLEDRDEEGDPLNRGFTEEDLDEDVHDERLLHSKNDKIVPEDLFRHNDDQDSEVNDIVGALDEIFKSSVPFEGNLLSSAIPTEFFSDLSAANLLPPLRELKSLLISKDPKSPQVVSVSEVIVLLEHGKDSSSNEKQQIVAGLKKIFNFKGPLPSLIRPLFDKYPAFLKALRTHIDLIH